MTEQRRCQSLSQPQPQQAKPFRRLVITNTNMILQVRAFVFSFYGWISWKCVNQEPRVGRWESCKIIK